MCKLGGERNKESKNHVVYKGSYNGSRLSLPSPFSLSPEGGSLSWMKSKLKIAITFQLNWNLLLYTAFRPSDPSLLY